MWKYTNNEGVYARSIMNSLEPKPCALLGLGGRTRLPVIEINILMQYFRSHGSRNFRDFFTQSKQPIDLPIYQNFTHQASIILNIGLVEEEDKYEWTRNIISTDVQDLRSPGEKRSKISPHVEKLDDHAGAGVSTTEVSMICIFIGRAEPQLRTSEFCVFLLTES